MLSVCIYLDESGDLGWKFDRPYRTGGSSRFLTIAALSVPSENRHIPKRAMKRLYKLHSWDPKTEKKWSDMDETERKSFAKQAKWASLKKKGIVYYAITVKKENVESHIRNDENKIYNYMIKLLLLNEMAKYDKVTFIPDPKSIKVASGNSLHDYLQTELWFEKNTKTIITTQVVESSSSLNLQFADMLAGLIQSHHEDDRSAPWNIIQGCMICKRLYF